MYWDSAATTEINKDVRLAMLPYIYVRWENPSAIYEPAMRIRRDIEEAREKVAAFINADPDEIYFTSGGSESNSWVFNGYYRDHEWGQIATTKIEHHSIQSAVTYLNKFYYEFMPVDEQGHVKDVFLPNDDLVSIQMANNEIGTIQDIAGLVQRARAENPNVLFHTDAVQAFGKIPIDVKALDVDYLSASGHKIGTPKGVGILYMKKGKELPPMIYGSQERGYRGGTENVPYIIGLGKATELIDFSKRDKLKELYLYAESKLEPIANFNGDPENRLWNIMSITIKKPIDGNWLIGMLHEKEQYVSAGSACNAHNPEPSETLLAIGLSEEEARRTIRISFPDNATKEDVDILVNDIKESVDFLSYGIE